MLRTLFAAMTLIALAIPPAQAEKQIKLSTDDRHGIVIMEFGEPDAGIGRYYISASTSGASGDASLGDKLNGRSVASFVYETGKTMNPIMVSEKTVAGDMKVSLVNPGLWMPCFANAQAFTLKSGEAIYIGRFSLKALEAELGIYRRLTKPQTAGNPVMIAYHSVLSAPPITPPDQLPGWEERINAYLKQHHPKMTAPVRAAQLRTVQGRCVKKIMGRHSWIDWEPVTAASAAPPVSSTPSSPASPP